MFLRVKTSKIAAPVKTKIEDLVKEKFNVSPREFQIAELLQELDVSRTGCEKSLCYHGFPSVMFTGNNAMANLAGIRHCC